MQTSDGFITRTPFTKTVNGQASYNLKLGGNRTLVLLGDVFNIFNTQTPIDYDSWVESTFGAVNPDFGKVKSAQNPRQLQFAIRFTF